MTGSVPVSREVPANMGPLPLARRFQARQELVSQLPVVCEDAFSDLLDQMQEYFEHNRVDKGWPWDTYTADVVAVWAHRNRLEADWVIDRVSAVAGFNYMERFLCSRLPEAPDLRDPKLWRSFERSAHDFKRYQEHRLRRPYGVEVAIGEDEPGPPRRDSEDIWDRGLDPVLAWPDTESREAFLKRALVHYELRRVMATQVGLAPYRKAPALERHVVWLLQQRVLRMSLDSIADLAQQERVPRRGRAGEAIDARQYGMTGSLS